MHDEPGILGEEGRRRIMMTMTLRIALVLVSLGTFSLMMRKIRQSKLQIESAIFWIVLSIVLVVFSSLVKPSPRRLMCPPTRYISSSNPITALWCCND